MPLRYVAPNVRTCDYCGARTKVPYGLGQSETRRRLEACGWTCRDYLVLCPRCQAKAGGQGRKHRIGRMPLIGRYLR